MKQKFGLALLTGASAFVVAWAANAQTAANTLALEEVVVTGSRVVKNGNDSPTPVTVISVEESEAVRPATIAEQLNDMPQFAGSRGQLSNNSAGSAGNGNPNPQANVLNLRNFGVTRTLILSDGHRVAPTSPDGSVDVDMIPQMLLQRVDVVTGGASAVYGADAVTGVVNFVTDTKFNGLKINGQAGQSVYHDDPSSAIGLAWGGDLFGGRGHALASYEYRRDDGVDRRSTRPFFANRPVVHPGVGANATVYSLNYFVTHTDKSFGGLISALSGQPANPYAGKIFTSNGVIGPYAHGTPIGTGQWEAGGDGSYFDTSLKAALKMHQIFGRLDFDFTDDVHGYVKAAGTTNYNGAYSLTQPTYNAANSSNSVPIRADNPYLAQEYRTALATAGVTAFQFAKTQTDAPRQFAETFERQYSIDTGLNVKFANGYEWQLALVQAGNTQKVRQNNAQNGKRLAAALDSTLVTSANVGSTGLPIGSIVCNVALTNPGLYPGCVPYNPFGPSTLSADATRYIFLPIQVVAHTGMTDVETSLTGAPFSTWAGPVNMALSAQWRKLTYSLDSTTKINTPLDPMDCTGLRLLQITGCSGSSQEWFQAASAPAPEVSVNVKEAAFEFDTPLLKDVFLARDVSVNGAVRYTNYSTSGSVSTWKAGLDWKFNDSLSFRGTRSKDIRAPTLFELYQPVIVGNFNGTDFWTGCSLNGVLVCGGANGDGLTHSPAATFQQGNANLKPEVGNTTTAGFVYRPEWAPGLSVSIDGFFIDLTDSIASQNGNTQAAQLACGNSGGTSPLCALIVRPISCCSRLAGNSATALYQTGVNLATQWTQGADLEINYNGRLLDMPFNVRALTTYQPHNVTSNPLTGKTDTAGFFGGAPTWRASVLTSFSPTENFKVSILERYRNRMAWVPKQSEGLPALTANMKPISPVYYTNLNLGYLFKQDNGAQTEFYANVANLFDRAPPIAAAYNNTQPGIFGIAPGDDPIGRYYTVGFRYRMR